MRSISASTIMSAQFTREILRITSNASTASRPKRVWLLVVPFVDGPGGNGASER